MGHAILNGAKNVSIDGKNINVNIKVEYMSFSAHADAKGNTGSRYFSRITRKSTIFFSIIFSSIIQLLLVLTLLMSVSKNKPGTAQVGALSKAQKDFKVSSIRRKEGDSFETRKGYSFETLKNFFEKSRTMPKKIERGTL